MDGTEGCSIGNEYGQYDCLQMFSHILLGCLGSELYDVGQLLKCEVASLRSVLLSKSVDGSEETLITDLSAGEGEHTRNALCRTLFSRLFTYLVARINESIKVGNQNTFTQ